MCAGGFETGFNEALVGICLVFVGGISASKEAATMTCPILEPFLNYLVQSQEKVV